MALPNMAAGGAASPVPQSTGGTSPSAASPAESSAKIPQAQAGYMELTGAEKDGDCSKVDVQGGVSLDRGCCNEFQPQDEATTTFSCGNCEYGSERQGENDQTGQNRADNPMQPNKQPQPNANHPLQQLRAKPRGMIGQ
jgi:hypothetical protein